MFVKLERGRRAVLPTILACMLGCLAPFVARADDSGQESPQPAPSGTAPSRVEAYAWQDVTPGQQVPVHQAFLDKDGYRVQAENGETITVPFVNDDLNAMKFARSTTGQSYFVNNVDYPVLYLGKDSAIASSAAQNAQWNPLTPEYTNKQPVYVDPAPDWESYQNMGWAPNMTITGGMYGPNTGAPFFWMRGYNVYAGGVNYPSWGAYSYWYIHTPTVVKSKAVPTRRIPASTNPWPGLAGRVNLTGPGSSGFGARAATTGSHTASASTAPVESHKTSTAGSQPPKGDPPNSSAKNPPPPPRRNNPPAVNDPPNSSSKNPPSPGNRNPPTPGNRNPPAPGSRNPAPPKGRTPPPKKGNGRTTQQQP